LPLSWCSIAATLLVIIWLTARRILADAGRALTAAEAIRAQTQPNSRSD